MPGEGQWISAVKERETVRTLFDKWAGSNGQIWEYACGHGTLLARFFWPDWRRKSSLYLLCKDCRTVRFPSIGWKNVSLQLREKLNPAQNDEDFRFEVEDGDRFYMACWALRVIETEKRVHIDWPPESRIEKENQILV